MKYKILTFCKLKTKKKIFPKFKFLLFCPRKFLQTLTSNAYLYPNFFHIANSISFANLRERKSCKHTR